MSRLRFRRGEHYPTATWRVIVLDEVGFQAASYLYAGCVCGQEFVVRQRIKAKELRWTLDAHEDLPDARDHFRRSKRGNAPRIAASRAPFDSTRSKFVSLGA